MNSKDLENLNIVCTPLLITNNTNSYWARKPDPDDRWDNGRKSRENDITGMTITDNGEFYDVLADFVVEENKSYYLMYAEYSTGDSFGSESGIITYIGLFKNLSEAEHNKGILEKHYLDYQNDDSTSYVVNLKLSSGLILPFYAGDWLGYFNSLQDIHIQEMRLT